MNKNPVKFGIIVVLVGAAITGYGLLVKIGYDNCLELIKAFERGGSGLLPGCPVDDSAIFFFVGLPVTGIGIIVLVLGIKDTPILEQVFGRSG